jgi:hypothetical protein
MVKTAIGGAYEERARQLAQTFERIDTPKRSSTPDVVARKIVKAATTRRPKTRYPVGKQAAATVRTRKMLPDRAMDAVITRTLA